MLEKLQPQSIRAIEKSIRSDDGSDNTSAKIGDIFEAVELGIRLTLAVGFSIGFAILTYTIGASVWSGLGMLLALCSLPLGFIYGFFLHEINFCLRMIFKAFRMWIGF